MNEQIHGLERLPPQTGKRNMTAVLNDLSDINDLRFHNTMLSAREELDRSG